jgi:flavorubredoxin
MKSVIIYWSKTRNTEKVAFSIKDGLESAGVEVSLKKMEEAGDIDFYDYDLICFGFPSHQWHPPESVVVFLKNKFSEYRKHGYVKLGAPKVGKYALIFCTYSGPHTGINEAVPAGKYVGQFFEHLGFTVLEEWYILSEFHGSEERSTKGRMGDIRGKPNEKDLRKVKQDVINLLERLNINPSLRYK